MSNLIAKRLTYFGEHYNIILDENGKVVVFHPIDLTNGFLASRGFAITEFQAQRELVLLVIDHIETETTGAQHVNTLLTELFCENLNIGYDVAEVLVRHFLLHIELAVLGAIDGDITEQFTDIRVREFLEGNLVFYRKIYVH